MKTTVVRTPQDLGAVIKRKREALKLTQTEFAKLVGADQQRVSAWETGSNPPTIKRLFEVLESLALVVKVK